VCYVLGNRRKHRSASLSGSPSNTCYILIMQQYWPFININTSTRRFNLSANCAMNCMTTTSFSQPVAGAWCAMCWATEESTGVRSKTKWRRHLELKIELKYLER